MERILFGATHFGTLLLKPSFSSQVNVVWRRTHGGESDAWPYWQLQETDPESARARVREFFGKLDGAPPPKGVRNCHRRHRRRRRRRLPPPACLALALTLVKSPLHFAASPFTSSSAKTVSVPCMC